ncbi:hypothetical protein WJX73_007428 [Symbiochloris irregularis]|uniref:Chlorophyll a-b binding protein, chloroplastic n=1 Tax=Symbiochloris irregularis TaxID=706552 RepID=A0AAW1P2B3_9CHLO
MANTMLLQGPAKLLSSTSSVGAPRLAPHAARNVRAQAASLPDRPLWYPGREPPAHLDGTLPGDFGFDPLGLSADEEKRAWFVHSEVFHCRTAMTAVAGILIPDLLTKAGVLNVPQWYESGRVWQEQNPNFPYPALLFVEFVLAGFVEGKRWADYFNPGSQGDGSFFGITDGLKGQSNGYPGGIFDPFGFSRGSEQQLNDYKLKEIKNGRLALIALVGFVFQHSATGKGPLDNLIDHIADPAHVNVATNGISLPFVNPITNIA